MILRALYDLAHREQLVQDPDFPLAPVAWLVSVSRDGRILSIGDTRVAAPPARGRKPKLVAKALRIPRPAPSRSGTKAPPSFFVDNAKYVFGLQTQDKRFSDAEGREKSAWFRAVIEDCVRETQDAGARAVLDALEDVAAGRQQVRLPDDCMSNDLFAFICEPDVDVLVHMRPAVQRYWRSQRRQGDENGAGEAAFQCMVTGAPVREPGLFPKVKFVPGGQTSGTPLVSFNAAAFTSYGLRDNENAPISREAAEACATALQRLLHPAFPDPSPRRLGEPMARRNLRLSDDTVVCYWSNSARAEPFVDAFGFFFEPDPAAVGEMYRSVWHGRPSPVEDAAVFYALTLSGAQGRMIVRDWIETSVAETSEHLARHFGDLEIVRNTPAPKGRELPEVLPLKVLLGSLAPFGKQDAIPASLASQLFHAALGGTPYPIAVLQHAIERARAEAGRSEWADLERRDARAQLIKAVLNRRRRHLPNTDYPEITVALDPANTNPGYLCGRLMAVIERLQQVALGDVNASVVDRYFGAASATPRAVFVRLLRNAQHHARKAQDDPTRARTVAWLKRQVDEISAHFDPRQNGFPPYLDLEEQGLFILGYHQQRHALWSRRTEDRSAAVEDTATAAAS